MAARPITREGIVKLIPDGGRVFLAGVSGEPPAILPALLESADRLRRVELTMLAVPGVNRCPLLQTVRPGTLRVCSFMGTPDLAAAGPARAGCIPAPLSRIPQVLAAMDPFDVGFFQVSPPDRDGWCTWALSVDINPDALGRCRVRVAQVNRRLPRVGGESAQVPLAAFDFVLWEDAEPFRLPPARAGAVERAIARHVAELVPDGATVQIGFGSLPRAILEALGGKRDLGVHSGMLVDTMADLYRAGVITGRRKSIDEGQLVATSILGTDRLFALAETGAVSLRPVSYTHDAGVLARLEGLVAINSAFQVDLTGQVNAEWLAGRQVSGPGGQPDFIAAANRSPGGLAVIALPSVNRRDGRSSIVAQLPPGAPVTTPRHDVGVVVTEYGVADLRGRTLDERAEALIAVAHPDVRESLRRAWLESS